MGNGKTLPTVDNLIALSRLYNTPLEGLLVMKEIPTMDIRDFGLVYVFRGKVCWTVYNVIDC